MSDEIPAVCFMADVAKALRMSERNVRRLRSFGTFPIRELPSVDKRPRWSGEAVRRFIAGDVRGFGARRTG
jgi:hypothetical protein